MKIQYREFEDSAMIAMGGGEVMKIGVEKIKPTFSIFSVRLSSTTEGLAMIGMWGGGIVWVVG